MQTLLRNRKGFTLVELLIVMTIIGILSVILFRTFGTVSELTFRIEQQKNVSQEIVTLTQIIQNYADRNQIDYPRYLAMKNAHTNSLNENIVADTPLQGNGLVENMGIVDVLYLSGQDGQISLFTSGNCVDPADQFMSSGEASECVLYLQKGGTEPFQITNPKKITLSKMIFKIIPFASQEQYLTGSGLCEDNKLMYCLNTPGFRIIAQGYNPRYSPAWTNKVQIPIQQFFTLK